MPVAFVLFEYGEGCLREWDAVGAAHLRSLDWNRPQCVVEVDLSPPCAASLVRACRCQDGESDGQGFEAGESGRGFVGRCGGEVPGWWFPLGQDAIKDFARRIGLEISLGDDPGADQAEALPEASGEFGVRVPARLKHAQDVSDEASAR